MNHLEDLQDLTERDAVLTPPLAKGKSKLSTAKKAQKDG